MIHDEYFSALLCLPAGETGEFCAIDGVTNGFRGLLERNDPGRTAGQGSVLIAGIDDDRRVAQDVGVVHPRVIGQDDRAIYAAQRGSRQGG